MPAPDAYVRSRVGITCGRLNPGRALRPVLQPNASPVALRHPPIVARAPEAPLPLRQATMTYYSKSSERTKTYLVHPYRLAYAQGGLYLLAYVPEYGEVRTFATERIRDISLLEDRFTLDIDDRELP